MELKAQGCFGGISTHCAPNSGNSPAARLPPLLQHGHSSPSTHQKQCFPWLLHLTLCIIPAVISTFQISSTDIKQKSQGLHGTSLKSQLSWESLFHSPDPLPFAGPNKSTALTPELLQPHHFPSLMASFLCTSGSGESIPSQYRWKKEVVHCRND